MRAYIVSVVGVVLLSGVPAWAQAPAEPKVWTVAASAGLALTHGIYGTGANCPRRRIWTACTR